MRSRVVLVVCAAAAAAAVFALLRLLGVPAEFAIAWIVIAAVVGAASRQVFFEEAVAWPPEKPDPAVRGSEVSRLAWAVNPRTGAVGRAMLHRLERVVRHRLRLRGLDLEDPEHVTDVESLLGAGVWEVVTRMEAQRSDVERVLRAIETLPPIHRQEMR